MQVYDYETLKNPLPIRLRTSVGIKSNARYLTFLPEALKMVVFPVSPFVFLPLPAFFPVFT